MLWRCLLMSVPWLVSQFCDVWEKLAVQMKDILSLRGMFQWTSWTVIAIFHKKVLPNRRLGVRCCILSVLFTSWCGSRCIHLMLSGFWRVRTAYSQHFAQEVTVKCSFCLGWEINRGGLKDFPILSVVIVESWFCRKPRWCTWTGVLMERWIWSFFTN